MTRSSEPGPDGSDASAVHWIEVPRTARYLSLGPEDADELWIVLHGYGQLARRFLRRFAPIDDGRRRIVAPEALSRFYTGQEAGRHGGASVVGATWMTREARAEEISDYVRYLDLLADRVARHATRRVVLGFSQGVATACRWTALGSYRPDLLVLWGDFLPPDLDLRTARARWQETEVVLVRGEGDAALASQELADEEAGRVSAAGLTVRTMGYAGGHDIEPETLRRLAEA